jgi:hypothetical protein
MPKDATRNIDRYKIRGGHMNEFEFHRNQGAVSQQEQGDWPEGQAAASDLPPDQAKAERVRQLLAEYGETVPEPVEKATPIQTGKAEQSSDKQSQSEVSFSDTAPESIPEADTEVISKKFEPTHGRSPQVIKEMLQSRRATDVVPESVDVAAGRRGASARREKAGLPANTSAKPARPRPTTRKENKVTAKPKKVQAGASDERNKLAPVRSASEQKNTTKAAAKRGEPKPATRKSAKRDAAIGGKQTTSRKSAKKAATARSEKQPAVRKSTKKVTARKTSSKSLTQTRKAAGSNKTQKTRKTAQTTTAKASAKSTARKRQ